MQPALKKRSALFWLAWMFFIIVGGPSLYVGWEKVRGETQRREAAAREVGWIVEALEAYKNKYGAYPRPVGGSLDPYDQAKMLYQAVTGDGTNYIDGVPPVPSDGNPGTDGDLILEAAFSGSKKSDFVHEDFYLIDPWGHPFRYVRGNEGAGTLNKTTFDLWSPGSRDSDAEEGLWIRNG